MSMLAYLCESAAHVTTHARATARVIFRRSNAVAGTATYLCAACLVGGDTRLRGAEILSIQPTSEI